MQFLLLCNLFSQSVCLTLTSSGHFIINLGGKFASEGHKKINWNAVFQLIFLCPSLANFPPSRSRGCTSLIMLHECPLLMEWAELKCPKPLIT